MSRFRLRSIGTKIMVRTVLVVLLPLLALSGVVLYGLDRLESTASDQVDESREQLSRESVAVNAEEQAVSVAREINATLLERIDDVTTWARNPLVIAGAQAGNELAVERNLIGVPIEELEEQFSARRTTGAAPDAQRFLIDEISFATDFGEVFFTDANGYNAALTNLTSDFVQSDEDWWQDAWTNGLSISDVEFDESSGIFSVDVSARIDDLDSDERLGVMKASLSIAFVQSITSARAISSTEFTVALPDGRLIAETDSFHNRDRLMVELVGDDQPAGITEAVAKGGAGALVTEESVYGYTRTSDANFLGREVGGFKGFDWIVMSRQQADVAFSPLRGLESLNEEIDSSQAGLRGTVIIAVLVAAVAAIAMSRFLATTIVGPIRRLTAAASSAATTSLPTAVRQIDKAGGDLDSVEVPRIRLNTGDELDKLASSFNSVQGTALRLASEQAMSRRNTSDMFVNLGRRNNSLLKRQLRFIDDLERNETDPDTLDSLFKLDHIATRMRRNAESLLVLAGERSPRRWSAPVPMKDAVQSALAEVEEYQRADITQVASGTLQGNVVADVSHILAELIENAITFSPPQTSVIVHGRESESGYTITVTDEGIGMSDEEFDVANERLGASFELSQVPAEHIGLYVVGRLARQHGIEVSLTRSPTGGTMATVDLPTAITSDRPNAGSDEPAIDTAVATDTAVDAEPTPAADATVADEAPADERVTADAAPTPDDDEQPAVTAEVPAATAEDETTTAGEDTASDEATEAPAATAATAADEDVAAATEEPAPADATAASSADAEPKNEGRRADDPAGSFESDARRGLDDPPGESVKLGEIEIPRRRSGSRSSSGGAEPPQQPAADGSSGENGPIDSELGEFGFRRREKQRNLNAAPAAAGMVSKAATATTDEEIEATADKSRSQWSSFQRGKESAESEGSDAPSGKSKSGDASASEEGA